ncbi:MAG: class I SAM-dependent methyltransferase, partial [Candidatus Bathyarchaeota archaeon]|nr:class I SAM-dependent methyltransferase [Candidatus Bathyarchaeota archaeon]
APENVRNDIKIMDISLPVNLGKYDLVISTEVAEHLPKGSAETFIANLTTHASNIIFFTAADLVKEEPII